MKTISFWVKLPDSWYEFSFSKQSKCVVIAKYDYIDAIAAGTHESHENIHKIIAPDQLVYAVKEFRLLDRFRCNIYRLLKRMQSSVFFEVVEPINGRLIDYAWCSRALALTWEKVEIENLMSWLSTLGGAFSALGDSFEKCAERAGRISVYQLKLALKSGDPTIVSRCKLYYSISLIQKGQLKAAKRLVLQQYEFAKIEREAGDERVYKMCHGIWLKLQHAYTLRKQARQKSIDKAARNDAVG